MLEPVFAPFSHGNLSKLLQPPKEHVMRQLIEKASNATRVEISGHEDMGMILQQLIQPTILNKRIMLHATETCPLSRLALYVNYLAEAGASDVWTKSEAVTIPAWEQAIFVPNQRVASA